MLQEQENVKVWFNEYEERGQENIKLWLWENGRSTHLWEASQAGRNLWLVVI